MAAGLLVDVVGSPRRAAARRDPGTETVNTIVAGNQGGECGGEGELTSRSSLSDDASCPFDLRPADARLGPLNDNGGATQTHALLAGSPAIDAASFGFCPETDQRGVSRPQGEACDIGAYESEATEPVPAPIPTPSPIRPGGTPPSAVPAPRQDRRRWPASR